MFNEIDLFFLCLETHPSLSKTSSGLTFAKIVDYHWYKTNPTRFGLHQSMVHSHTLNDGMSHHQGKILASDSPMWARIHWWPNRGILYPYTSSMTSYKSLLPPGKGVGFPKKERIALNCPCITLLLFWYSLSHHSEVTNLIIGEVFFGIPQVSLYV